MTTTVVAYRLFPRPAQGREEIARRAIEYCSEEELDTKAKVFGASVGAHEMETV